MATQPISAPKLTILSKGDDRKSMIIAAHNGPTGYQGMAVQDCFITSESTDPQTTVIMTNGVGSCVIAVVHCLDGTGALGHISFTHSAASITDHVNQMILALAPSKVQCVVLAGSSTTSDEDRDETVKGIKKLGVDDVQWVPRPEGDFFGSAVYLPKQHKLALFTDDDDPPFPIVDGGGKMLHWNYRSGKASCLGRTVI
jgi:hypothetical protein